MAKKKKKNKGWAICSKKGWKVYMVFATKEEADSRMGNPEFYEVRELL